MPTNELGFLRAGVDRRWFGLPGDFDGYHLWKAWDDCKFDSRLPTLWRAVGYNPSHSAYTVFLGCGRNVFAER